jgi:CRISPR-associated endoribonuclease Cas6
LCERWNRLSDSLTFDSEQLKSIAQQYLIPIKWKGETRRVNLSSKAGVTGFVGSFTFDMKALPEEYRRIFIILVEFALFSGIGRLTGQGLGNIKVDYD